MAQAAVHRAHEASLRLAQILDTNRPVATRVWKPALGMVGAFSMCCLMALPHAPQFVAFDRGALIRSSQAYSVGLNQASFPTSVNSSSAKTAVVIPALLRMRESSSSTSSLRTSPNVVSRQFPTHASAQRQLTPARTLVAQSNAPRPREVMMNASRSGKYGPEVRTLFFIETTQYVIDDSSVWSVQVWRVTVLSTNLNRWAKVPTANSI